MTLLSFRAISKCALFGSFLSLISKVEGESFYHLKLHWEESYGWKKAQLCAACVKKKCNNGLIALKICDENDESQLWEMSVDKKIRPKSNMDGCLSFKDLDAFVRLRQCKKNRDGFQKMNIRTSGIKSRIEGEGVGKRRCLSTVSSPDTELRLKMIPCAKASRNDAVYWIKEVYEEGPTPKSPTPSSTPTVLTEPTTSVLFPGASNDGTLTGGTLIDVTPTDGTITDVTPTDGTITDTDVKPTDGTPNEPPSNYPYQIVLGANNKVINRNTFVFSPNRKYKVGLTGGGNLVLQDQNSNTIWNAGVKGGYKCSVQGDGNVVIRSEVKGAKALWSSETYKNPGAQLVVDNGGRIGVLNGLNWVWFDGIPRGNYIGPSSEDLKFPTRGIFYYPWYPETWTINGHYAHFKPDIGFYSSSDPRVAKNHIDAFEYAHIDLSIASWWGPNEQLDRARITMLMDETIAMKSNVKWSVYHEDERKLLPSSTQIKKDLDYLKKWFAWHPAWAHVNGRPVIFVYNEGKVGCNVVKRWMDASDGEWFVVLKLFQDFTKCERQPDHWHQYGVGGGKPLQYEGYSFSIAPGFWKANSPTPKTPRVSEEDWCKNVKQMAAASGHPWHLIISFNEAGEGTMIEASSSWASNTDYGFYLDCLNKFETVR